MADAPRDNNFVPVVLLESSTNPGVVLTAKGDEVTGRLLVDSTGGGSGTVTTVSVVSANGFAGSVANATTTPAITLSTTITGILKGNGTAISAATAGTDYTALAFKTISVAGQSDVVADSAADTLTLVAGSNITITTDATTDTITIAASGAAVPTTITVANEATDTTCFIAFFTAATGDLGPKTNANLTFDSSTGVLTAGQTIVGSISGNAGTASAVAVGGITGLGTNVATALAVNVGTAGAFVVNGGALGTPSSGTVTNLTGTASININGTVGATTPTTGVFTTATVNTGLLPDTDGGAYIGQATQAFSGLFLDTTATINFDNGNAVITHSSGVLTVSTGDLRVTTAGTDTASVVTVGGTQNLTNKTYNKLTVTAPASGSTLTIIDGKTLTVNKSISFTAADDTGVYTLPTGTKTLVATDVATLSSLTTAGSTLTVTTGYQISGAAASNKILKGNGTNFVASTETYAAPGTSGNVMTSDGTNWTSAAPSSGSWAKVQSGTLSAVTTFTISSLDGNTDKIYRLTIRCNCSASDKPAIRFNADTGSNYDYGYTYTRRLASTDTTSGALAQASTSVSITGVDILDYILEIEINAKTSAKVVNARLSGRADANNYIVSSAFGYYRDTSTNITSITIFNMGTITTGDWILEKPNF